MTVFLKATHFRCNQAVNFFYDGKENQQKNASLIDEGTPFMRIHVSTGGQIVFHPIKQSKSNIYCNDQFTPEDNVELLKGMLKCASNNLEFSFTDKIQRPNNVKQRELLKSPINLLFLQAWAELRHEADFVSDPDIVEIFNELVFDPDGVDNDAASSENHIQRIWEEDLPPSADMVLHIKRTDTIDEEMLEDSQLAVKLHYQI